SVGSRARGRRPQRRPGRDFPASAIRAPLRGYRRPWGNRCHRYCHDALRGGGANRSRRTYAGTRPEEEQNLFVPPEIASCRGICRCDLMDKLRRSPTRHHELDAGSPISGAQPGGLRLHVKVEARTINRRCEGGQRCRSRAATRPLTPRPVLKLHTVSPALVQEVLSQTTAKG